MKRSPFKPVYLFALFPIASILLYLLLMLFEQTDPLAVGGLIALVAISLAWGAAGFLFGRSRVTFGLSLFVANALPILTTAVYTVLYVIATFAESANIMNVAELIGGLGTGLFGVLGTTVFALVPFNLEVSLFEVYINLIYTLLVFSAGYAIGVSRSSRKKKTR